MPPRLLSLHDKEHMMNEDKIKGQWKQLSGKLKAKWG